jgi:hypothetical protein
MAHQDGWG